MSSLSTIYTPLESLLLFQALRSSVGNVVAEPNAFTRIANELKSVPLVRNDPSYDPERLSADALRQLYLELLKEEAKRDLESQVNGVATNGDSPTSRKRKAPSPKLPTVQEAARHAHLIPQLISRLYIRYRENIVKDVREQEQRYEELATELKKEAVVDESYSNHVHKSGADAVTQQQENQSIVHPAQSDADVKRHGNARIGEMINHGSQPTTPGDGSHRRTTSGTILPPLSAINEPYAEQQKQSRPVQPSPSGRHAAYSAPHARSPANAISQSQMQLPRNTASPRPILPPPSGLAASPAVGTPPSIPSPQQYQAQNAHFASSHPNMARAYSPSQQSQLQPQQAYYQQQYQHQQPPVYQDQRMQYAQHMPQQAYQNQPHVRQSMNFGQPPYQQDPYQAQHRQQYQNNNFVMQQTPVQNVPATASTAPRPIAAQPGQRYMSDVLSALATPPRVMRQPVWKSERRPAPIPIDAPASPTRPDYEPLSPVLARALTPAKDGTRSRQSARSKKAVREASLTTSATTRNTRSVSIGTDENSTQLKHEPSGLGIADSEEPEPAITSLGARTRRGTLQPNLSFSRRNTKQEDEPVPRSNTIIATRNFAKMSSVMMNDIVSHKHGSRFAQPVRDKDADGYSTFIKRPQNLKSIRAALTYGQRALNAATSGVDSPAVTAPSTPSSMVKNAESTVELERSVDLIPPKAIVNGAQLEKEIMRMFANAVMFNPGEDGMVADAREMFEDVDAKIGQWRGAEREPANVGGVSASEDGEEDGRSKRRKL